MKLPCLLFLLSLNFVLKAQNVVPYEEKFSDSLPIKYRIEEQTTYWETMERLRLNKDQNLSQREKVFSEYATSFATYKAFLFNNGGVYTNWDELEDYVNKVFKKIAPPEIASDTSYRVHIARDPENNASAGFDQKFYLNIGCLAYLEDEAMLAAVLAHELGHYVHYHNFNSYVRFRRSEKASGSLYNVYGVAGLVAQISARENAISDEREADAYALKLLKNSGYSLKSAKKLFVNFSTYNQFIDQHTSFFFQFGTSMHPSNEERIMEIEKVLNTEKKKVFQFQVDKDAFFKFKTQSIYQTQSLLIEKGHYHRAIVLAFEQYLLDPENKQAIAVIMEGIRRWALFAPYMKEKMFITYSPIKISKKPLMGAEMQKYLSLSDEEFAKIKAIKLSDNDSIEFKTYQEAFDYFSKKGTQLECTECLLTLALSDKQTRIENLNKYIEKNGKYSHYAKSLLTPGTLSNGKIGVAYAVYSGKLTFSGSNNQKQDSLSKFCQVLNDQLESVLKKNGNVGYDFNVSGFQHNYYDKLMLSRLELIPTIYAEIYPYTSISYPSGKIKAPAFFIEKTAHISPVILDPEFFVYAEKRNIRKLKLFYLDVQDIDTKSSISNFYTSKGLLYALKVNWKDMFLEPENNTYILQTERTVPLGKFNHVNFTRFLNVDVLK